MVRQAQAFGGLHRCGSPLPLQRVSWGCRGNPGAVVLWRESWAGSGQAERPNPVLSLPADPPTTALRAVSLHRSTVLLGPGGLEPKDLVAPGPEPLRCPHRCSLGSSCFPVLGSRQSASPEQQQEHKQSFGPWAEEASGGSRVWCEQETHCWSPPRRWTLCPRARGAGVWLVSLVLVFHRPVNVLLKDRKVPKVPQVAPARWCATNPCRAFSFRCPPRALRPHELTPASEKAALPGSPGGLEAHSCGRERAAVCPLRWLWTRRLQWFCDAVCVWLSWLRGSSWDL